ncbi:hypothetical protein KSP39_PZI011126 [Platanthera zijinensis]|uniref:Uncharacterized protein n=1 Tax=Platanthera zijinensis TaxID=2320716 RepID=A0AAP0G692_9ASPA
MEPPAANIAGSSEANYLAAIAAAEFYPNMGAMQQHQQQQYYNYYLPDPQEGQGSDLNGSMITNGVGVDMNINGPASQNGLDLEMLSLGQVVDAGEDEAARPLVDMFEMRPAFGIDGGDSREMTADSTVTALPYSAKIEPNDEINHMENVLEEDLKSAASLFTLTNCNTR